MGNRKRKVLILVKICREFSLTKIKAKIEIIRCAKSGQFSVMIGAQWERC